MAERIEVLMPILGSCPAFVVDTTGPNFVDVAPDVATVNFMAADNLTYLFRRGDNFTILSLGYFIPDNFITYELNGFDAVPSMRLYAHRNVTGDDVALFQFGMMGLIRSPFPNYEMAMGVSVDVESFLGEAFSIRVLFGNPGRISMINVPASLNGLTFHVVPFIKVLHNFPLT